ncbi:TPA: hypothetical protein REW71_001291 [Klebsiella pneumoniae]|nr:hypothetical protein [Klebsiella pneumoniae]
MDLFIEYRLQMPVIAGFLVMRFLSGYTLVYTVFLGAAFGCSFYALMLAVLASYLLRLIV